jgi:hypothetical protein
MREAIELIDNDHADLACLDQGQQPLHAWTLEVLGRDVILNYL